MTPVTALRRLLRDDDGQDLVEYALLCAFVAFFGVAAWASIVSALGASYTNDNSSTQSIWVPDPPAS